VQRRKMLVAQDNPHQKQNEAISDEKFLFEKEK